LESIWVEQWVRAGARAGCAQGTAGAVIDVEAAVEKGAGGAEGEAVVDRVRRDDRVGDARPSTGAQEDAATRLCDAEGVRGDRAAGDRDRSIRVVAAAEL